MKRKNNMLSPQEKESIVKRYLNGESITKMAKEKNIGIRQIYHWVEKYQNNGIDGLKSNTGKLNKNHPGTI